MTMTPQIFALISVASTAPFGIAMWFIWKAVRSRASERRWSDTVSLMHQIVTTYRYLRELRLFPAAPPIIIHSGSAPPAIDDLMFDRIKWLMNEHIGEDGELADPVAEMLFRVGRTAPARQS